MNFLLRQSGLGGLAGLSPLGRALVDGGAEQQAMANQIAARSAAINVDIGDALRAAATSAQAQQLAEWVTTPIPPEWKIHGLRIGVYKPRWWRRRVNR